MVIAMEKQSLEASVVFAEREGRGRRGSRHWELETHNHSVGTKFLFGEVWTILPFHFGSRVRVEVEGSCVSVRVKW